MPPDHPPLDLGLAWDHRFAQLGQGYATELAPDPLPAPRLVALCEPLARDLGLAPDRLRFRVWERGAGITEACGSGACAAIVNTARRGLCDRRATVVLDGGELAMEWRADGHVTMAGPVATSFTGELALA